MRQQELALHTFRQSDIYIHFHQAADFSELSETDWQELQRTIDETFNRFTARLYALSPLSERELRICLLVKAEIQPTGIAQLTGRVKSTITSARKNLFEKLCGKKAMRQERLGRRLRPLYPGFLKASANCPVFPLQMTRIIPCAV